ncbi:MAG: helix-turn-helix domain-containing protein [Ktedonobacteraceae bacterium]|nr:helix-turn-helix domain-containing protein [Ktedonobacteraceae bacterium]
MRNDRGVRLTEAAARLGVSESTIRRYIDLGRVQAYKVLGVWRVRESELERIMRGKQEEQAQEIRDEHRQPVAETAFVEQAIACYVAFLEGEGAEGAQGTQGQEQEREEIARLRTCVADLHQQLAATRQTEEQARQQDREITRLRTRVADLERQLTEARRQLSAAKQAVAGAGKTAAHRFPAYEIWIRHAPGPCPALPEGLAYRDYSPDIQPQQCPRHRVFAESCTIERVRERIARLKAAPGILQIWGSKNGSALERDAWLWDQEKKCWVPDW